MKFTKKISLAAVLLCGVMLFAVGCGEEASTPKNYEDDVLESDLDFSKYKTVGLLENAYRYKFGFRPEADEEGQGYVGDTMPYYENGTYYVYYLKDEGDSLEHSIYLATTTDLVHWEDKQEPILTASTSGGQEAMLGTGSVVKAGEKYYFFYTGHRKDDTKPIETIRVAEGTSLTSFTKKTDWELTPTSAGAACSTQDFRDPQAYYNADTKEISLTVTTQVNNKACIVKYTLNESLTPTYDGVIHTKDTSVITSNIAYNLECSDTFKVGDKWYLTFSAQNDVLYYVAADSQYGPYDSAPKPLEGHIFYAAKHVSDGTNTYMVGWSRRAKAPNIASASDQLEGWAGNMQVQKVVSDGNGGIRLAPVDAYTQNTQERVLVSGASVTVNKGDYTEAFRVFERYMVTGKLKGGEGATFGFAFDFNGKADKYKTIEISPADGKVYFKLNNGSETVTSVSTGVEAGKEYAFTFIQEGSVGVLYVEGQMPLTVRLYGAGGKKAMLYAKGGEATFTDLKQYTYTY